MARKKHVECPTGSGTLGLLRPHGPPLIQKPDRTASGKDMCAQAELDSVKRNRSIPFESERAKALRLQREAMPVDVNPLVPDFEDGIASLNRKPDDDETAI